MTVSRRSFIKNSAALFGAGALPLTVMNQAQAATLGNKTLVVLYLRGGADGLQLVTPTGPNVAQSQLNAYKALRPARATRDNDNNTGYYPYNERNNLAADAPEQPLALDGFFELHPRLSAMQTLYNSGDLAVIHAVGAAGSRSHFDAQDATEYGTPFNNGHIRATGWLHDSIDRQLGLNWDDAESNIKVAAGISMTAGLSKSLMGSNQSQRIVAMSSLGNFQLNSSASRKQLLQTLYDNPEAYQSISGVATATLETESKAGTVARGASNRIFNAANSPDNNISSYKGFTNRLEEVADMIKDDKAPAFININLSSWDSHDFQFNHVDSTAAALDTIAHFYNDLGGYQNNVCTLVMSEFGRTLDINGDWGTDHGHAGSMFIIGGGVTGNHVYGNWPGLPIWNSSSELWEPADNQYINAVDMAGDRPLLRATTSFQQIYYELLRDFVQIPQSDIEYILKGYSGGLDLGLFT